MTLKAGITSLIAAFSMLAKAESPALPVVPQKIPEPRADGTIYLDGTDGVPHATNINPLLQARLTSFLIDARSPIAAVVVADVKTGAILAMAQGRSPESFNAKTHTALHPSFPAASIFKTVVTTAALEMADFEGQDSTGLIGGCAHVRESGDWLSEKPQPYASPMSLKLAFGKSCNGYFAKIAVNQLGIGIITNFARRYGWETGYATDFFADKSPFMPPTPETSSTHTVGSFAAGFGKVGLSAVHAAHLMMTIAHGGRPMPLRLFRDTPTTDPKSIQPIYSETTSQRLSEILESSVKGGTASFAFRRGKYKKIRDFVGGKTGTLTGTSPRGLTTWFAGLAPIENPEVVVASVVLLEDRWVIKGPNLAAEGFLAYFEEGRNAVPIATAVLPPKPDAPRKN